MTEESTNKPAESMVTAVKFALAAELARQKCAASAGVDLISGVIPPLDMAAMARAAIAAMREPPKELQEMVWFYADDDPEFWWQAMIDKALNEGEKGGGG